MTQQSTPLSVAMPDRPHRLAFIAYGTPTPQGSKVAMRGRVIHANAERLEAWRLDVKAAALFAMEETPEWAREYPAIAAHFTFTLARPKLHYRSGKFAHLLREDAPRLHTSQPDLDKLVRATCDALTAAGAYADDSQIAQLYAVKAYASTTQKPPGVLDRPGVRVVLEGIRR